MEPFKNNFSPQLVSCLAGHLEAHVKGFDRARFESAIICELDKLALKERIQLIADHIHKALPEQFEARNHILLLMLHPIEDASIDLQSNGQGVRGWGTLPLCAVVGQHGLDCFEGSLALLREMTSRFSSEFDVRYFLQADQRRALNIMSGWIDDPNGHVRRLVSEGTRPRLPWATMLPQIVADPSPIIPLLEALRDDEEEFVRRSVANNLNDIAKDHPDFVADLAQEWMRGANENRKKLLRHACRTLVKQGHSKALEVFGFRKPKVTLLELKIETRIVEFGKKLDFVAQIKSASNNRQLLVIDYVVHFKKNNGSLAPKVFKWKTISLTARERIILKRSHAIRKISTRKYYRGKHALSLRINGQDFGLAEFYLDC